MGKPLDGRSDVYALGVVAYEMITGRLPFPDAKGPAGLITAQLKQTPQPPSTAYAKALLPPAADRAILKCLEKDKNNRYADVSALAAALEEVLHAPVAAPIPPTPMPMPMAPVIGQQPPPRQPVGADLLETKRGDMPNLPPPPLPPMMGSGGMQSGPGLPGMPPQNMNPMGGTVPGMTSGMNQFGSGGQSSPSNMVYAGTGGGPGSNPANQVYGGNPAYGTNPANPQYPSASGYQMGGPGQHQMQQSSVNMPPAKKSNTWVWIVVGLLAIGAAAGAVLAIVMK
jgi:serine/threonine protein kinase